MFKKYSKTTRSGRSSQQCKGNYNGDNVKQLAGITEGHSEVSHSSVEMSSQLEYTAACHVEIAKNCTASCGIEITKHEKYSVLSRDVLLNL